MAKDGGVPVDPRTLETPFPNVYAVGDIANAGTPKAGMFAEGAAKGGGHRADRTHPRRRRGNALDDAPPRSLRALPRRGAQCARGGPARTVARRHLLHRMRRGPRRKSGSGGSAPARSPPGPTTSSFWLRGCTRMSSEPAARRAGLISEAVPCSPLKISLPFYPARHCSVEGEPRQWTPHPVFDCRVGRCTTFLRSP